MRDDLLTYREARRAFVAAADAAGMEVIARVHPAAAGPDAKSPDGRPLFLDTASLGPRHAARAILIVSGVAGPDGAAGSRMLTGAAAQGWPAPPGGARVVLVHGLNPYGFAHGAAHDETGSDACANLTANRGWPAAALANILAEHAPDAAVLDALCLGDTAARDALETALARLRPGARVRVGAGTDIADWLARL